METMFKLASLIAAVAAREHKFGGSVTTLEATSGSELSFNLASVEVNDAGDGSVSLRVPGWMKTNEPGEPELPVLRASMLLPRGVNPSEVRAVVHNAVKETFPLSTWGDRIKHSQGKECMCNCEPNSTIPASPSAYIGVYPASPAVNAVPTGTWRDVEGVVVEVLPVSVDHTKGVVEVLHSCDIKLEMTAGAADSQPLVVDPAFYKAYAFVFSNWEHQAHEYEPGENGRVLVIYESKYQSQAQSYADLIKSRGFSSVLMQEAGRSADDVKSVISQHYKESAGLTYVTIIGRQVPAPRGSHSRKECDNCYAQLSGKSLDVFVGRLSGGSASDIDTQLAKIKAYDSTSTAAWNTRAHGTAFNLAGDEYKTMTDEMGNFGSMGFSEHDWEHGSSASGRDQIAKMNKGLGVFSYLGHGSGSAWNTPSISVRDIRSLTNHDMPFFEIDVSCNNGGFQSHSPCLGEALLTSKGGAIATMMSAPTARGTMCKHQMVQQSKVLSSGKASRVGQVYFTALTAAQAEDPDDYMLEAYNVFGDPTLQLAFAKSSPAPQSILV